MYVWYHLSTILNRRLVLRLAGILTLCVAFITMLFFSVSAQAAPGINQTISFQGRLLSSAGAPVPDGFYNVQFKIYEGGSGADVGNTDGTLVWTESHINNGGSNGVKVTNGYMSVALGSKTPFATNVDWNNDTLWLSMNIAGLNASCSTFNTGNCTADGEMTPMKRLTSTPYALNAGMLGGKTADGFIQNGTTQQTGGFNISGTGIAGILRGTSGVETSFLDRTDAGLLSIGTQNATSINIGSTAGNQVINIGTGTGDKDLAIGSTDGASKLSLQGGSEGVNVASTGGFTVRTEATETDTLVIGSDGSASINLSNSTDFVVNDTLNQSVLRVGSDGQIETGSSSNLAVNGSARFNQGIQVGNGTDDGQPSLMTLDKSSSTPTATGDAILGSMYYDTTLGKVQCYEADGWGACSSSPDIFVTLSPQYSNAVTNGNGIGDMTSDFCSDALNINDASTATPVCGTDETYNFYNWTSSEMTAQTKSIYVTYQLPSNFTKFVEESTSLAARTDSSNATVTYEIYKNTMNGLVGCGTPQSVSTGAQTSWQKKIAAANDADPADCSFSANESVVFKINLTSSQGANAYVSNLGFAFSNN